MADKVERPRDPEWRTREYERMIDGTYIKPVWENEPFWLQYHYIHREHYAHISPKDPGKVVYIASKEKGEKEIYTTIKVGRYLTKYFSEVLNEKQIAYYAQWQITGKLECEFTDESLWTLEFATTPEDIAWVYINGPHSCMDGHHFPEPENNPTRVYGAGDLAVAYLYNGNREYPVRARALVWPDRLVAGRVYPTPNEYWCQDGFACPAEALACQQAMTQRLKAMGYKMQDEYSRDPLFNDARLLKIPSETCYYKYVMPYLDRDYGVRDGGDCWHMARREYEYEACETCGYIETEERNSWSCERCGEDYEDGDYQFTVYTAFRNHGARGPQDWCLGCREANAFRCDGLDLLFSEWVDHIQIRNSFGSRRDYIREWAEARGAYESEVTGAWYWDVGRTAKVTAPDGRVMSQNELEQELHLTSPQQTINDDRQAELIPVDDFLIDFAAD